ncbi:MAG TPA: GNAT family N-acetyltransferase [Candidatus Paceibacterota bacterium]|nr:GNAT family N-acetyltransferase [Candidatus Paceibacterota bacterium]
MANALIPTIAVGLAAPSDAHGIQDVFYWSWITTYPSAEFGITVEDIEYRYQDRHSIERIGRTQERIILECPAIILLVAKDGNSVVGLCRIQPGKDSHFLQSLYILPAYQGRGIGGMLWKEAQKYLSPCFPVKLWVTTYNARAIRIYERWGFAKQGTSFLSPQLQMRNGSRFPLYEMIRQPKPAP